MRGRYGNPWELASRSVSCRSACRRPRASDLAPWPRRRTAAPTGAPQRSGSIPWGSPAAGQRQPGDPRRRREAFGGFGTGSGLHVHPDATFRLFAHDVDDVPARRCFGGTPARRPDHRPRRDAGDRPRARHGVRLLLRRGARRPRPVPLALMDLAFFFVLEERGFLGVHGAAWRAAGAACCCARRAAREGTRPTRPPAGGSGCVAEDIVWIAPDDGALWGMPWTFHSSPTPPASPGARGARPFAAAQRRGEDRRRPGSAARGSTPLGRSGGDRPPPPPPRRPQPARAARPIGRWEEIWEGWLAGGASRERDTPGYEVRATEAAPRPAVHRLELGDDLEEALDLLEPLLRRRRNEQRDRSAPLRRAGG